MEKPIKQFPECLCHQKRSLGLQWPDSPLICLVQFPAPFIYINKWAAGLQVVTNSFAHHQVSYYIISWTISHLGHFEWQDFGNLSSTEVQSKHNCVFPREFFSSVLSDAITPHGARQTKVMSISQYSLLITQLYLRSQTTAAWEANTVLLLFLFPHEQSKTGPLSPLRTLNISRIGRCWRGGISFLCAWKLLQ